MAQDNFKHIGRIMTTRKELPHPETFAHASWIKRDELVRLAMSSSGVTTSLDVDAMNEAELLALYCKCWDRLKPAQDIGDDIPF